MIEGDYKFAFQKIIHDPRYLENLDWGVPRAGHPEGTIRAHIAELEDNLLKLRPRLSDTDYWRLKLLIHTHDTFKPGARQGAPISSPESHASRARALLAEFCDDADLLAMVQSHDEPYAIWRQLKGKARLNQPRLEQLLKSIADWNVFMAFLIIDGCTPGKDRTPLAWFFESVRDKVPSKFTAEDIL